MSQRNPSYRCPISPRRAGITLTEIMVVVGVIGVMAAMATPALNRLTQDQAVKTAIRSAADAFRVARSEAIRSGNSVFVVMIGATGAADPTPPELRKVAGVDIVEAIVIVNDGPTSTANCMIDAGEILHRFRAVDGVAWGTSPALANTTAVPMDLGPGTDNIAVGSSFTDATLNPNAEASWVVFHSDGLPRAFTPTGGGGCTAIGPAGRGGGGIYVTNTTRDFAAVLSPLGTVRVHAWGGNAWRQ